MRERGNWVSESISLVYETFFLRDILGFVLPGFIALSSLAYIVGDYSDPFFVWLYGNLRHWWSAFDVGVTIGFSYLSGLVLQAVHFGVLDWLLFRARGPVGTPRVIWEDLPWPLRAIDPIHDASSEASSREGREPLMGLRSDLSQRPLGG